MILQVVVNNPLIRPSFMTLTESKPILLGCRVPGFYRVLKGGGCSRGGGNWGTLRIPREDWGTLGKIRGITTPP